MKPRKPIRRSQIRRKAPLKKRAKSELSSFKKKLWIKFAAWVKRTKGNTCFSCGKPDLIGKQLHAGHMFSAGKYPAIRWDVWNVWPQCAYCNIFLKGNYIEFHARFKEKYGAIGEYSRLHESRNNVTQWRLEDLKEVERMIDGNDQVQVVR